MPIVHIVGSEGTLGPPPARRRRTRGESTRYTVKCRGLTEQERCALESELDCRFERVLTDRRNPYLPPVDWHKVSQLALAVGTAAVPKLVSIIEAVIKERIARGRKAKTVVLYGPDGKIVKQFRKSPLR